jgi:hypothetical protein
VSLYLCSLHPLYLCWCVLYERDNCLYRDLRSNWLCCITQYSIMLIYMDDVYHVIWLWSRLFWWYQLFIFPLSRLHFSCLSMFIHYLVVMWFCLPSCFIYNVFEMRYIDGDACFSLMTLCNTWIDTCNIGIMNSVGYAMIDMMNGTLCVFDEWWSYQWM